MPIACQRHAATFPGSLAWISPSGFDLHPLYLPSISCPSKSRILFEKDHGSLAWSGMIERLAEEYRSQHRSTHWRVQSLCSMTTIRGSSSVLASVMPA